MNCRSCSLPNSGAVTDRPHTSARCGWRRGNCGPPRRDTPPPMTANFWPGRASAASARNAYSTSGTRPSLGGVVVSGRSGLTVLYDADCGVCSHTARMLVRADGGARLRLVSIQSADLPDMPSRGELMDMLHARDEDGRWFKGAAASVEIARRIPIAWPLTLYAKLPLAIPILDFMYRAFAANRHTISRMLGLKACKGARAARLAARGGCCLLDLDGDLGLAVLGGRLAVAWS